MERTGQFPISPKDEAAEPSEPEDPGTLRSPGESQVQSGTHEGEEHEGAPFGGDINRPALPALLGAERAAPPQRERFLSRLKAELDLSFSQSFVAASEVEQRAIYIALAHALDFCDTIYRGRGKEPPFLDIDRSEFDSPEFEPRDEGD